MSGRFTNQCLFLFFKCSLVDISVSKVLGFVACCFYFTSKIEHHLTDFD